MFYRCLSVHTGGTPVTGPWSPYRGLPQSLVPLRTGVHASCEWGTPKSGSGVPPTWDWRTPCLGPEYPFPRQDKLWTGYAAVGMPLAFSRTRAFLFEGN